MRSYLSYDNRRGNTYGAGLKHGSDVHTRGWHAGVNVTVRAFKGEADSFDVYMTSGSNGGASQVHLGTVTDTADGPRWLASVAAEAPLTSDSPDHQPRMSDESRGLAVNALQMAVDALLGTDCTFSMCEGPDAPFTAMKTCRICSTIQDLRAEIARITR